MYTYTECPAYIRSVPTNIVNRYLIEQIKQLVNRQCGINTVCTLWNIVDESREIERERCYIESFVIEMSILLVQFVCTIITADLLRYHNAY